MKQINVINAYSTTEKLSDNGDLPINTKWILCQTRKTLRPHYEFQVEQNKQILEKYNGQYDQATNQINFETIDQANGFQKEHDELDNLDVEVQLDIKPTLKLSEIPNITVHQMETLEAFIEFIPE